MEANGNAYYMYLNGHNVATHVFYVLAMGKLVYEVKITIYINSHVYCFCVCHF